MVRESKRENFDVTPEQEADINCLQELLKAPSRKDTILTAVRLALHLAAESRQGNQLYLKNRSSQELSKLLMIGIDMPYLPQYLVEQAHPWKRQLFVKGRKLTAAAVWTDMLVNKMTPEQAANSWELPVEAVHEIVDYCQTNRALLEMESAEEMRRLEQKGIAVEPKTAHR